MAKLVTALVTGRCSASMFMAVSPRIHWVNLSFLTVLDVLPGGFEEVEADYVVVGLHSGSDGAESGVVNGADAGDQVCEVRC